MKCKLSQVGNYCPELKLCSGSLVDICVPTLDCRFKGKGKIRVDQIIKLIVVSSVEVFYLPKYPNHGLGISVRSELGLPERI